MTDAATNHVSLAGVPSGVGTARGAKASGLLTVNVGGRDVVMLAARDVTFAAGDLVSFVRVGSRWAAVARLGTAAVADQPDAALPPDPQPATVSGTTVFSPVETRSWAATRWRTDTDAVIQGNPGSGLHTGAAFYGLAPRSLAGATVTAASLMMRRRNGGGTASAQAITLALITEQTRPSGAPTRTASTAGPSLAWSQAGSVTVPTAWAQAIIAGTSGAIGVYDADGTPYVELDGLGGYAGAFALTVDWSRTS